MKKIYIKTFGCQMNVYDSSRMLDLMKNENYEETNEINNADIVILNTCNIREKAKEKIFTELGQINVIKRKKIDSGNGYTMVFVTGCVAQAEGEKIFKRMPVVDAVIGPGNYHKLPEIVKNIEEKRKKEARLEFLFKEKFDELPHSREVKGITEFITVQEGCDKFCSYCVVPYTRGREFSRQPEDIINEVILLRDKGVKEITLLGQNVDNYKAKNKEDKIINLAELIFMVSKIDGIERIRYMTSYPSQVDKTLIDAHKDIEKLMPFIHLPVQSGSNSVLKLMNRRYTAEQYLDVVEQLRISRPDIAISSDFIVGFAGETDKDFEETLELVKKVKYASSFSFKYSPRPNTPGAKMKNQIDEKIKGERLTILQNLLEEQQSEFNSKFVDKIIPVLVEANATGSNENYFGKSPYLQTVIIEDSDENIIGKILNIKVEKAGMKELRGKIIY